MSIKRLAIEAVISGEWGYNDIPFEGVLNKITDTNYRPHGDFPVDIDNYKKTSVTFVNEDDYATSFYIEFNSMKEVEEIKEIFNSIPTDRFTLLDYDEAFEDEDFWF